MYGSHPAVVDLSLLSPPVKLQSCGFSSGKTTTFIDNKSATTHCTHPDHMGMGSTRQWLWSNSSQHFKRGSLEFSISIRFQFLESSSATNLVGGIRAHDPPTTTNKTDLHHKGSLIFQIPIWIFCTFLPKTNFAHHPSITKLSYQQKK